MKFVRTGAGSDWTEERMRIISPGSCGSRGFQGNQRSRRRSSERRMFCHLMLLMLRYLSVIDPLSLDLTERENTVDGRTMKTASDREKWYNRKTKALVELQLYEECLSCIDEAFQNVDHFHNNCNHWLNYRKALCLFGLGDLDGAEKTIKDILGRFELLQFVRTAQKAPM